MSCVTRKPVFGVSTRSDTNLVVKPQKIVRSLEFRIGLYYPCIENKGTDLLHSYAPINNFPQRRGGGGGGGGAVEDTLGIRQQNNPNPRELDGAPRHGIGKLDTFSKSSKLNYLTNLMAHPRDFGHKVFANVWGISQQVFKIV